MEATRTIIRGRFVPLEHNRIVVNEQKKWNPIVGIFILERCKCGFQVPSIWNVCHFEFQLRSNVELLDSQMPLKLFTRYLFQSRLTFIWYSNVNFAHCNVHMKMYPWQPHITYVIKLIHHSLLYSSLILLLFLIFFLLFPFRAKADTYINVIHGYRSSLWWLWLWLIYTYLIRKLIIKCYVKSICFMTIETDIYVQCLLLYIPVSRVLLPYQCAGHNQRNYTNQLKESFTFAFPKGIVCSERFEKKNHSERQNQPITHWFGSHIDCQIPRIPNEMKKLRKKILNILPNFAWTAVYCNIIVSIWILCQLYQY